MQKRIIDHLFYSQLETDEKTSQTRLRFFSRKAPQDQDDVRTLSSCYLALSSTIHQQFGGTCYANAVATAVRATEMRIVGRVSMSHKHIVQQIVAKHGTNGGNTFEVLKEECFKRQLGCGRVEIEDLVEVLQANRTMVVAFHFTEDVWHAFSSFFTQKPTSVLTRQAIEDYRPDYSLPSQESGHAVCTRGLLYDHGIPCIEMKNSWGPNFADGGNFKVGLDVVVDPRFNFELFDVFFRVADLLEEDFRRFEQEQDGIRRMKTQMLIRAY